MLNLPRHCLAFIGAHASRAYALSIFVGLALPQLAAMLRPAIPLSIFVFIMLAFARANLPGLRIVMQNPGRLSYAVAVSSIVPPLVGWVFLALPIGQSLDPGTRLAIALMASAPPLMASPVYAALLGFENSFALTALVIGMVITPITAPLLVSALAGAAVPLSPLVLAERLAIFIGGGMVAGLMLRRITGVARLTTWNKELDGVGVLMFFLFAIAAMDGVLAIAIAKPMLIVEQLALSFGLSAVTFAIGYLLLQRFGFNDGFSVSICIGLRNMGMLIVPIISIVPTTTFLYFALAQVPVYVAPVILKAVKAWLEPPLPSPSRPEPL